MKWYWTQKYSQRCYWEWGPKTKLDSDLNASVTRSWDCGLGVLGLGLVGLHGFDLIINFQGLVWFGWFGLVWLNFVTRSRDGLPPPADVPWEDRLRLAFTWPCDWYSSNPSALRYSSPRLDLLFQLCCTHSTTYYSSFYPRLGATKSFATNFSRVCSLMRGAVPWPFWSFDLVHSIASKYFEEMRSSRKTGGGVHLRPRILGRILWLANVI